MDGSNGQETISAPVPAVPSVVALRVRDHGRRLDLGPGPRWVVGKSPSCDLALDDPYVSSVHCVLERRADGALIVRDAESKNGTFLDGTPVIATEVRPGAVLVVGRTQLDAIGSADPRSALEQLRGSDPAFRAAVDTALRAARSDCSVLILGETGTGKELIAAAIHEASRRAAGPLVAVNCGALPRELISAELFGHVRGAFTGAIEPRDGVFVQASGGTLFLDELGELPRDQQPHLLRALEARRVRPVGGSLVPAVDVRFVAATNQLAVGGPDSPLRADLYHRVAAVTVPLPPLRDRAGDVPELARAFLDELAVRHGPRRLTPAALDHLAAHAWPGNVRELRQTMVRAVTMSLDEIDVAALHLQVVPRRPGRAVTAAIARVAGVSPLERATRDMMAGALSRYGTVRAAARAIGMPKSTFAEKARRYGLTRPDGAED